MADAQSNSIIDLTNDSFTLADHCNLANLVIELLEDSFTESPLRNRANVVQKRRSINRKKVARIKKHQENAKEDDKTRTNGASGLGDCPICFDELGKKPLASTKCGHVFCLQCLMQALHTEKRCPKCRRMLKGSSAYHPLYV